MASTDNAVVNIPLAKRGDLAKLAEHSVREERAAFEARVKAARRETRAAFAEAKGLIEQVSDARMAEMGRTHGLTAKQTRAQFIAAARKNPALLIKTMTRELAAR